MIAEHAFYKAVVGAATSIDVMEGDPNGPGLPILRAVTADDVGVSIIHASVPAGGTWTLRLHKKAAAASSFSEVATFSFDT